MKKRLVIGARKTPLAMTELQEFLREWPGAQPLVSFQNTRADLYKALALDGIDFCVGSAKDFRKLPDGISQLALRASSDTSNALVSRGNRSFADLESGARVGVASQRLIDSLSKVRGDLDLRVVRGAVDARLQRVIAAEMRENDDSLDAVIVANIAMKRLGMGFLVSEILDQSIAPGSADQGKLALCALSQREDVRLGLKEVLKTDGRWEFFA